jgi:hypothetical protein
LFGSFDENLARSQHSAEDRLDGRPVRPCQLGSRPITPPKPPVLWPDDLLSSRLTRGAALKFGENLIRVAGLLQRLVRCFVRRFQLDPERSPMTWLTPS